MIKKISAFLIAMTLTIGCLASCNNKDDSSSKADTSSSAAESIADSEESSETEIPEPSLTIDGQEVDTTDLVICTIDGKDVDFETFRYFYYYALSNYSNYGIDLETIAANDGGFETFLQDVITCIKQEYVAAKLAEEQGLTLTEEDEKAIEDNFEAAKAQFESEEEYQQALKESYMTEEFYKKMLINSQYYEKLFGDNGAMVTSLEDFKEIVQDNDEYSRVIHILIPYECTTEITDSSTLDTYEDLDLSSKLTAKQTAFEALSEEEQEEAKAEAKKLAEDVLAKAQSGEDFSALMAEYGWDPGMESSPQGYYITPETSFVQEFLDASFALKENEISGLVENSSYGWFIIKRLPVDMDYVEENYSDLVSEYDTTRFQEIYSEETEKMEVTYSDIFEQLTVDSIT